jgi:hypothetical protein
MVRFAAGSEPHAVAGRERQALSGHWDLRRVFGIRDWKSALDGAFQKAPWKTRVADLRLATNAATVQYGV